MKLLVVEDDLLLQEIISDYFQSKGWEVETVDEGEMALSKLESDSFHLMFLDVMLPGMDGSAVCRKARKISDIPIIFITARVLEEDELNGYSAGGDDYVIKPFSLPVLYAKSMALMGRVRGEKPHKWLRQGQVEVNVQTHEVRICNKICSLPPKEYEILVFFMENPNRIFSREQLLIRFWGYDFDGNERVVDNHIKKLRKAMKNCGCYIQTVRKSGYRMEVID